MLLQGRLFGRHSLAAGMYFGTPEEPEVREYPRLPAEVLDGADLAEAVRSAAFRAVLLAEELFQQRLVRVQRVLFRLFQTAKAAVALYGHQPHGGGAQSFPMRPITASV